MKIEFEGRHSDGQTAGVRPVQVRLDRAVEIRGAGAGEPVLWAFHRLGSAVPVALAHSDVLLTSLDHAGETLFVRDPAFAAAVLARAPQLTARSQRWRYARPMIYVAAVLTALGGLIYALDLSPARTLAQLIPKEAREAFGRQALAAFTVGHAKCQVPEGVAALARLERVLEDAAGPGSDFSLQVVDWEMVNAFALPGEQIVLLRGLIDAASTPDEVAGVLAHEMGHGIELDPEAGIIRALGISAGFALVLGGSGSVSDWGAYMLQLSYTRGAERRADEHSLRILKAAGISPKGIADFFDRLAKQEGPGEEATTSKSGNGVSSIFSTHPASQERARKAADAATYSGRPALSAADWTSLKSICGG